MIPVEKRKFRFGCGTEKKTIAEMTIDELRIAEKKFYTMSCAAGYADDGIMQDYWCGAEGLCQARIKELENAK